MAKYFSEKVVKRFMSAGEYEEFEKKYTEAKLTRSGSPYIPTEQDIQLYMDWLNDKKTLEDVAKVMDIHPLTLRGRFNTIAKHIARR